MEQEQNTTNSQAMQEEVPMRLLKFKTLTSTTYELRVPANMSIRELKLKVQEISGVPADRQRMICLGQQLMDDKLVSDYAKEPELPNWIHLVAKVDPQPSSDQSNQQQQQQQQQQQPQQQQFQQSQQPNNRRPLDMFGGNVQIQTGNVGDLNQLLGNITNLFGLPNNLRQQQPQQQQGQNQQPQQQNPTIQTASFTVGPNLAQTQPIRPPNVSQPQPQVSAQGVRSNLVSNQQPITIQRQIQLPHQELLNLGMICNNLMGDQSTFPGPPLPQIPNRTPAALIGSYLSNWQFQVQRTLPFVHRLAELLQREPYMTIPEDRTSTQALSLEVGNALNELVACTQPLVGILTDIQLNSLPGQVRFDSNHSNNPTLTRPHVNHPMQQNNQRTQGGSNIQSQPNNQSSSSTTSTATNATQQSNAFTQNFSQPNVQATISVSTTPITQIFQNQAQRPQTNTQPTQNQNQQQPQQQPQATINISQNPVGGNANINDLLSQISGGQNGEVRIGVMNSVNNDQEIQIVGIGQTHVVDGDSNIDLQQVLGNILGQVGNQNGNININTINTGRTGSQSNNANQQQQQNRNQNHDDEWEDEEDENSIGIEMSSTINLNGNNAPFLQNLLSGLGIQNNGNVSISANGVNLPQVSTTTISGATAANLISQLNRQNQQLNNQQQQQQSQQQPQNSASNQANVSQQQNQNTQNVQNPNQDIQQQQQPAQQGAFQMMMGGGANGGFNPLGMLMGGGLGGMMSMTVDELIRENLNGQEEEQSEADELIQSIIGQLRISDLVSSFISGQFGFLNTIQQKIRDEITSRNLGRLQFSETLASSLSQYLVVPEQHQGLIFEGIEPHNIALDVLESRLPVVFDIIFKDYPQGSPDTFSSDFMYEVKKIAGEVFFGIQECLQGGMTDLERIFRTWVNEPITRIMGEGTQGLVDSFITSMLWEKVKALVLQHQHENENKRNEEEQKQNNDTNGSTNDQMEIEKPKNLKEQEVDLLEDIENEIEKDETRFNRYNIQLSDEYKKGDFTKKNN